MAHTASTQLTLVAPGAPRRSSAARLRGAGAPAQRRGAACPAARTRQRTVCGAAVSGLLAEPWDGTPKSWRSFWAVKLAAAVVENSQETVRVRPIETAGLEMPPSAEEALRRLRTNAVLYRQNYLVGVFACLALGALRQPVLLAGLAALVAGLVTSSDRLLGEAALALDGQLAWNAKRVAGFDRALLRVAGPWLFVVSLALAPARSARWLLSGLCTALFLALAHAVLRPLDLESVMGSFWGDITASKNRFVRTLIAEARSVALTRLPCTLRSEDVSKSFTSAAQGLSQWWSQKKQTPAAPLPVIVVQSPNSASPPPPPPPPPPRGRLPGR